MYRYDQIDQTLVNERVAQFRDQTRRFLAGELSEDEFRPLRLRNGLYIQRYAPMLRVAIPYGLLSTPAAAQARRTSRARYDRGYGHFTTRQNIQFNWPRLERRARYPGRARHASRCTPSRPAATASATSPPITSPAWRRDELVDPRPYCEIIRQWATLHPEFSYLPRKFKIAVTASPDRPRGDRGARRRRAPQARSATARLGFEILVGGGLGRTPMIGQVIREFLPQAELLAYLEAILRVYNRYGRRDNIHKARIKILVRALGVAEFTRQVEAEFEASRRARAAAAERMKSSACARFFAPPPYQQLDDGMPGRSARPCRRARRYAGLAALQHAPRTRCRLSRGVRVAEEARRGARAT